MRNPHARALRRLTDRCFKQMTEMVMDLADRCCENPALACQ